MQSDQAKAVGVRDWPGLDMQAGNEKKRQQVSSAGRRFGRMTCGRCVALHPALYPEALPGLDIGGRIGPSDPLPAGDGGLAGIGWIASPRSRELRETAELQLATLTAAAQTLIRTVQRCRQVQ